MKRVSSFMVLLLFVVLGYVGETSILKAQVQYTTISICKICNDGQERGSGKCIGCNKYEYLTKTKAKIFSCFPEEVWSHPRL